jgi:putative lipoprotein
MTFSTAPSYHVNMNPVATARRGRSILPALALAVTLTSAPLARAGAAEPDPWFGRDKLLHFSAAGSLAVIGYANASMLTESRPARAATGGALAVGAGVAKELWDLDGHGDASWRDLTWDVLGAATGVLVSLGVDWAVHRMFHPPPGRSR